MKKLGLFLVIVFVSSRANSQELQVHLGADLVSTYVWRGAYTAGASIQPTMGISSGGFSIGAWGSVDMAGNGYKELDFTASYSLGNVTVAITDYWWEGESRYKYFLYDSRRTAHHFEAALSYVFPMDKFPLKISWNSLFAGADYFTIKSDGSQKRSYSSYAEASLPFSTKDFDYEAGLGITPWEGLYASGFSMINVSIRASKKIIISDQYSLPLFGQIIVNPRAEDVFFVIGMSF